MSQGRAIAEKPRPRRQLRAVPDLMAKLREAEIRVRLREAREEAGLSRDKMADLLTVHRKSIENYEKERVPWGLMNVWAEATGTSVEWLLHGKRDTTQAMDDDRLERVEGLLIDIRDALLNRPALTPEQQEALVLLAKLVEGAPKPQQETDEPGEAGSASSG